ncbi:hypothetical protein BWQ93_06615 [Sphingopyxis sp. QXT-31]|uniref:calcium-binding protein n=1 Tax=Sphingopyxis sp. QXT-31 TaxID=1357916 RepID=UPI0009797C1D|nr:M10 family metallopeptidase C-terminal domain-containing protein [Sphingopyxis sp. QXT-31]APZ98184.1 hypothetical protein BWQ93_06615 [Sphingopyxis sp. QXT-31]
MATTRYSERLTLKNPFTVAAGDELIVAQIYVDSGQARTGEIEGKAPIVNFGTIRHAEDNPRLDWLIRIGDMSSFTNFGTVEGLRTAATNEFGYAIASQGRIYNEGTIRYRDSSMTENVSIGVTGYSVENHGLIEVIADAGEAYGIRDSGYIWNTGTIRAIGNLTVDSFPLGAAAIYQSAFAGASVIGASTIVNDGLIEASSGGPIASIGLALRPNSDNINWFGTVINNGRIVADDAIRMFNGYSSALHVENNGTIEGRLYFEAGYNRVETSASSRWDGAWELSIWDDVIRDNGTHVGDVLLNNGFNTYVGTAGTHTGSVTGGDQADIILAGRGNQLVQGGAGNDVIAGGAGADTLRGGGGADTFLYLDFADSTAGSSDVIEGFEVGVDRIDLRALGSVTLGFSVSNGRTTVRATSGNNELVFTVDAAIGASSILLAGAAADTGTAADNTLVGSIGNDELRGGAGDDLLYGGAGNDLLDGGTNAVGSTYFGDRLVGGTGDDVYRVDDEWDRVVEFADEGYDRVYSTADFHFLRPHIEELYVLTGTYGWGNDGDNLIVGNDGANELDGKGGTDRLYGGGGNDRYMIADTADMIFEFTGGGIDSVKSWISYYLPEEVENLELIQSYQDLFGVGNALANVITGNAGDNLLIGGGGNDQLFGDEGNDSLFGEDGDDRIEGGYGVDYIVGGSGNDFLRGGSGADAVYGGDGDDELIADREYIRDPITGANRPLDHRDFVTDILVGGAGNDILRGNSGLGDYDRMDGGSGNDAYYVDTPADLTFEAANGGTDTVYANIDGAGYYLYAHTENLVLEGNTPFGVGNELDNRLTGNAIGNYLLGGAGNDMLNGKAGNDVLFGEGGADSFVFERGTGGDVIGDFARGTDKIDLSAFGFANFAAVQAGFSQVGVNGAINLGNGDFVVLHNVTMSQLTQGDFILTASAPKIEDLAEAAKFAEASAADAGGPALDWLPDHWMPHYRAGDHLGFA